ncbi:hypothetical protein ACL9Z5_002551 [Acinetobacter calcoaceticus]
MNLSLLSIDSLAVIVIGEGALDYLSGPKLVELFNSFGSNDDYWMLSRTQGFPSRLDYTKDKITEINGTEFLTKLIESLVDDRRSSNPDFRAELINKIIKHDGYKLEKTEQGVYKLIGNDLTETAKIKPVFESIEQEIIDHINSANYLVWVAVAWITSRKIARALYNQYKKGINIRIIVNDDDLTRQSGIAFENTNIEYFRISPNNLDFKNIMHHKFCVIDLKKVITGSFNWTNKASFNNENISIIEHREQAEAYAREFLKLIENEFKNI